LLLNVALHGLHQALGPAYGYVRYADDFIVCASSRERIEAAQSTIEEWLKPRGLTLHPEKTRIVHISDGFNFLSFSIYVLYLLMCYRAANAMLGFNRVAVWNT
jgi:RNA-directed DNA polymerase